MRTLTTLAVLVLTACSSSAPPYPYAIPRAGDPTLLEAEIIGVSGGGELKARLADGSEFDLRPSDIMTPVPAGPWSTNAIEALQQLVVGKHALVRAPEYVQYQGMSVVVGRVYVEGRDIAWEMVAGGNAWVWEAKSHDEPLKKLQEWAKVHRVGLWSLPESERVPPWEFLRTYKPRKMQKPASSAAPSDSPL